MYRLIKKLLLLILFPFLLGSICLDSEKALPADFNSYRVIVPNTGNEYDYETYSEEVEIIKANSSVVSVIKEYLLENKIDISNVNISLYLEELSTNIKMNEQKKQTNLRTISSPWLELTKTVDIHGKTEIEQIELNIDAGYVRLMMDLFSYDSEAISVKSFRSIPVVDSVCFSKIERAYVSNQMSDGYEIFQLADAFDCVPEVMKRPLLSLFESSPQTDLFPMTEFVYQRLDSCLDTAEEYYSELYPRLVLKALQILEIESKPEPMWWIEPFEEIESIQRCPNTSD